MWKIFIIILVFFALPGCIPSTQSKQQELDNQERVKISPIFLPLPGQVAVTLAKSINHQADIEQSGQLSSFQYLVWTPQMVYRPNKIMQDVQQSIGIFSSVWVGITVYPIALLADPPFFSYAWVEVKGSVDASRTNQLRKSLVGKAEDFYRDLNKPQSGTYDSYNNEYFWTEKKTTMSQKWDTLWSKSYKGQERDDTHFLSVSERVIQGDFLEDVRDKMRGQTLPALDIKQSRFESTRQYLHRVDSIKEKLTSYKNTLSDIEHKSYIAVESREKIIIYRLFVLYFGRPKITKINYNPDSRLFGIRVEGSYGGVFRFTLADRIMNAEAPDYEKRIRKAAVKILLRVSGGNLYIDGGYLVFPDGTLERILPFHEEAYQSKEIIIASFPKIEVPKFSHPKRILSNKRMKSEGEKIVRDTIYFQGLQ
jgi:hypothetical protein